jgi:hypothetical protein
MDPGRHVQLLILPRQIFRILMEIRPLGEGEYAEELCYFSL